MRTLILVRHAKSSWAEPGLADFDRPLNERGLRDAPVMAQRLAQQGDAALKLVSSPALRAITTAGIFAEALGQGGDEIQRESAIYDASPATLLTIVRGLPDAHDTIALFGHNPGLSELCHALARCDFEEMPTCALARIDLDVTSWRDVGRGGGRLMSYTFPKERQ